MSSVSGTNGGAKLVGQSEAVVGGYVPRMLFTAAGAPISPVFAGGGLENYSHNPSRSIHFRGGIYGGRPSRPLPVQYGSSLVPQHRGYTGVVRVEKRMEGVGEFVVDPLDNFKPQSFKESRPAAEEITNEEKAATKKDFKNTGRRAYKSENRSNRETPRRALIGRD